LEGFQISQIVGSTLSRQLRTLIAEARGLPIPQPTKRQKRRADFVGEKTSARGPTKQRRSENAKKAAVKQRDI
jgi:hypothetical protein